jgi:MFS family permease
MVTQAKPTFITLVLMFSFAAVNAVLFTPALPDIAHFFNITENVAQQTITWFLIGYAIGQLIYGPVANRFGRKPALYAGIILQIVSSLLCVFAGMIHNYVLLVIARFLSALGSGVGLKMTFTIINEYYEPRLVGQKIAYLMLAFAVMPSLGIVLGGILNAHFGWQSCFYAETFHGLLLLFLVTYLPETQQALQLDALKIKHLTHVYADQLKNIALVIGGILMGSATSFIYVFATVAPFIAINRLGMNSMEYGFANILPTVGLMLGSLFSAQFVKKYSHSTGIKLGIWIIVISTIAMMTAILTKQPPLIELFVPMMSNFFGVSVVYANASTVAMSHVADKAHGSAVMNFINMGLVTLVVLSLGFVPINRYVLSVAYLIMCVAMMAIFKFANGAVKG